MVHYIPFIHSLNLLSIQLFCYLSICTLVLLATTHNSIVQIPLNVLCIFHTSMLTYICTTFVFFVRITLVILHSNQRNCQGNARLKPSLPWAGSLLSFASHVVTLGRTLPVTDFDFVARWVVVFHSTTN